MSNSRVAALMQPAAWTTYLNDNRADIVLYFLLVAAVMLLRLPAHYEISIDDIAKFASASPYEVTLEGAARWNRFATVAIVWLFDTLRIPFGVFMFSGSALSDLLLVGLCIKLCRYFAREVSPIVIISVTFAVALLPQLFVLVHFHIIGYSLATTYAAMLWILFAANSERRFVLPIAIIFGGAMIAGSYQSGIYWYALLIVGLSLRSALEGMEWKALMLQLMRHGLYMIGGLAIYAVFGKLLSAVVVPPKHSFATMAEVVEMFKNRMNWRYVSWHYRDLTYFPKSLKVFMTMQASLLLTMTVVLVRRRASITSVISLWVLALVLCGIQILMFPYNYTHVPIRSFWWFGLAYAMCFLVFHRAYWDWVAKPTSETLNTVDVVDDEIHVVRKRTHMLRWIYNLNLACLCAVSAFFAVSTYRLGDGLTSLRALDEAKAEVIIAEFAQLGFANDRPVVLALGDRARVDKIHEGTLGATKTLFWASWTRIPFLNAMSGENYVEANTDLFKEGRQKCLDEPTVGPMPEVTIQDDYALVCL